MKVPSVLASGWGWVTGNRWRTVAASAVLLAVVVAVVLVASEDPEEVRTTGGRPPTTSTDVADQEVPPGADPEPGVSDAVATEPPPAPSTVPSEPEGLRFLPEDQPDNGTAAPLTGLPVPDGAVLGRPALAVKIDNVDTGGATARPQVGIAHADVVVEEIVEGGITRFVIALHSTDAPEVGPVRSARTTDIDLLPVFGRPLFAYSGGNPGVLEAVRGAPSIEDRGGEWAPAYVRVGGRRAPHNLFLRPWEVWNRPGAAAAPPVFASFRPRGVGSPVGEPVQGVALGFRGPAAAGVTWAWSAEHARWLRHQGGRLHVDGAGYAVGPRNVVVVETDYVDSPVDTRSPEGVTVGSGQALVLTDGRLVVARWQRDTETSPLALVDGSGVPVTLSAGRTWVELVPPGTATIIG